MHSAPSVLVALWSRDSVSCMNSSDLGVEMLELAEAVRVNWRIGVRGAGGLMGRV